MIVTSEHMELGLITNATQAGGSGAVAGILNGAKLVLYTNNLSPTKTTPVSALTQPTYTGYAPAATTWGAGARDAQGNIVTLSNAFTIQMGASADPSTTIMGWALTDTAGLNILMIETLANPLLLVDNLTVYNLVVPFVPGQPDNYSGIVYS